MDELWRIVWSMRDVALRAGVHIVTGDTKVVEKGRGDGLFINTAGIGVLEHSLSIQPNRVQPGDVILLNGDVGRHGMAIMAAREGLRFESTIRSDTAPLAELVRTLIEAGIEIHCLRDITRGGLAAVLNEIADAAQVRIAVDEKAIPVREDVHAACEILGVDPMHVACEGRFAAFVPAHDSQRALALMRSHPQGPNSFFIGEVGSRSNPIVVLKSAIGASRIVDTPTGEQLPRIC